MAQAEIKDGLFVEPIKQYISEHLRPEVKWEVCNATVNDGISTVDGQLLHVELTYSSGSERIPVFRTGLLRKKHLDLDRLLDDSVSGKSNNLDLVYKRSRSVKPDTLPPFLIRDQILQGIITPGSMRWCIDRLSIYPDLIIDKNRIQGEHINKFKVDAWLADSVVVLRNRVRDLQRETTEICSKIDLFLFHKLIENLEQRSL